MSGSLLFEPGDPSPTTDASVTAPSGAVDAGAPAEVPPVGTPLSRRERRRRSGTHPLRHVVAGLLILTTLGAGAVVDRWTPVSTDGIPDRLEEQQRSFVASGPLGSTVPSPLYDVVVHGVSGAGTLTVDRFGQDGTVPTTGIWVILDVTVTAHAQPRLITWAVLKDAQERQFGVSSRVEQAVLNGRELQPGIPTRGQAAFEVPLDALAGPLTLQVADGLDHRFEAEVDVTLPAPSADTVRAWQAARVAAPTMATASGH